MKFEKILKQIRKLDLDMIWDHDKYVKASPGSTLQSSNNGLTMFHDLGRKAGNFSASKEICSKKRFWHFFEKYRKSMFRSKILSWNHSESKEQIRNIFPSYSYERRISKSEKKIMHILLAFFKLIFMPNSLIKSLRKKINFSKSSFQPASSKHISDALFRFRMISGQYFGSRHGFSIIFKKVSKPLFEADLLIGSEYSTFSSQIVGYGQTMIGTL